MLRTEHTQCIHDLFGMRALSGSHIAGTAHPGASPHRVHPESPTEDTIYRERPRQRGNRNIGRDRHGESATRYAPVAREPAGAGTGQPTPQVACGVCWARPRPG